MAEKKYYTVWKGVNPGVYDSWTDCQLQIKGFKGALYKSFSTREEAEHAFASPAYEFLNPSGRKKSGSIEKKQECNLNTVAYIYVRENRFSTTDRFMEQTI